MKKKLHIILFAIILAFLILSAGAGILWAQGRILVNPSPVELNQVSPNTIIVLKDQGDVCLSLDRQTGKVHAKITNRLPVQEMYAQPLFQTASCKATGGVVKCSSLIAFRLQKAACHWEPWLCNPSVSTSTHFFYLLPSTYRVYIGPNYLGELHVSTGDITYSIVCIKASRTEELIIPPPAGLVLPKETVVRSTVTEGYPVTGYPTDSYPVEPPISGYYP